MIASPRPVPVGVDDVAGVAVAQQFGVIARVVGQRTAVLVDHGPTPVGGRPIRSGRAPLTVRPACVHTAAWVPTTDTVAYSSAALISPWVHSDASTCTESSEASGSTSTEPPYAEHAGLRPGGGSVGATTSIIGPPRRAESSRYSAPPRRPADPSSM